MSAIAPSVQLFVLAAFAFTAVGALGAAALVGAFGRRLTQWEPRARHRALVGLASLPLVAGGTLLLAASLPSIVALFAPAFDHCAAHDDAHAHLCFRHVPHHGIHTALLLLLVFVSTYVFLRAVFASMTLVRASRLWDALAATGEWRADLEVTVLAAAQPLCVAAGLLRPRVLISRGLLASLSEAERTVVLAHERAHVRRRDALVASGVRALGTLHLPFVARWLVRELEIAAEQACDEEAAGVSDRLGVASTILAVERAVQASALALPGAVAFGQRGVERRVEALLADPAPRRSLRVPAMITVIVICALLTSSGELHHLTESLLAFAAAH